MKKSKETYRRIFTRGNFNLAESANVYEKLSPDEKRGRSARGAYGLCSA